MFGNAPRAVWAGWCPPYEQNRIELACRRLLVREASGRTVLLETGIGAFFEPALRDRYGDASVSLGSSLQGRFKERTHEALPERPEKRR